MKCTNCGNEVPETANVCGYCGHRLKSLVSQPIASDKPLPEKILDRQEAKDAAFQKGNRSSKLGLWLAIIVIGFIGIGIIVLLIGGGLVWMANSKIIAVSTPAETLTTVRIEPFNSVSGQDFPTLISFADDQRIINITSNTSTKLGMAWCAATPEGLEQNFGYVDFKYIVDGISAPLSDFGSFDEIREGTYCRWYMGVIRTWPLGQHTIHYILESTGTIENGLGNIYSVGDIIIDSTYTINISQ